MKKKPAIKLVIKKRAKLSKLRASYPPHSFRLSPKAARSLQQLPEWLGEPTQLQALEALLAFASKYPDLLRQ